MAWNEIMKNNVKKASELKEHLNLNGDQLRTMNEILDKYPMSITPYYLSLCEFNDKNDPIVKMCIPSIDETIIDGSFDTSGEATNTIIQGMQHKYRETVMILSSNQCAMYCRHCFRKRLVGVENEEVAINFEKMANYVEQHKEVSNVLISGGDSFINSNETIEKILQLFSEIEHLDFIRFGTRVPVVFPSRISDDLNLLSILKKYTKKKQIYVVTQFNHPREITKEAIEAVQCLINAGVSIRNQAVLLKGINDNPDILSDLLKKLTTNNITPYYIFQCRPVTGVKSQFQVPFVEGNKIVQEAKNRQNGFGKHVRYGLSHVTGKIEIIGQISNNRMLLKYHEVKDSKNHGKIFTVALDDKLAWLPDNFIIEEL